MFLEILARPCRNGERKVDCKPQLEVYVRSIANRSHIKVYVKNKSYLSLLDSGADVSCIISELALDLVKDKAVTIHPCPLTSIEGVGGAPIPVLGKVTLPLKLSDLCISQSFIVLDRLSCPLLLGLDFLTNHQASLNFADMRLLLYNGLTSVPFVKEGDHCPIHVMKTTFIPSFTEVLLPVRVGSNHD